MESADAEPLEGSPEARFPRARALKASTLAKLPPKPRRWIRGMDSAELAQLLLLSGGVEGSAMVAWGGKGSIDLAKLPSGDRGCG